MHIGVLTLNQGLDMTFTAHKNSHVIDICCHLNWGARENQTFRAPLQHVEQSFNS